MSGSVASQGYFPAHYSKSVTLFGLRLRQVQEIAYKHAVERAEVRGNAREALGHTPGEYKAECSATAATVLLPYWEALKDRAYSIYGTPPLDLSGSMIVTTSEPGVLTAPKHLVVAFSGISEADASSSGNDASVIKLTFSVKYIKENGKFLIKNSIWENPDL